MTRRLERSLERYFSGYKVLVSSDSGLKLQSYEALKGYFERLRKAWPELERARIADELSHAPHFNIFRVLPIERRETLLHSPLLAHLLDPSGSHGQQCLFLQEFFGVAEEAGLTRPREPICVGDWSVRSEVYTRYGIIDLLIECEKQSWVLAVENKIDAREQETQLARYSRYLCEQFTVFENRHLVFLTTTGYASELSPRVRYVRMSYVKHVLELLARTIPRVRPVAVRRVLQQYESILGDWRSGYRS